VEIDMKKLFFIAFIFVALLLGGCGVEEELVKRGSEISRLNDLVNEQYGTRAAELDFAERQVGIYQGCTFLFNVCSEATLAVGKKYIKDGFTGASSYWWWVAFAGKLTAIAAVMGALLWLPRHLFALFTRPVQDEIEAAKKLIEGLDAKVKDANRKRTQTQQETSAMKREFERLSAAVKSLEQEVLRAKAAVAQAKADLAETTRLKESFKRF
jgi:multidrug efflux pump subunit AcrA (membrane-fusion protein)